MSQNEQNIEILFKTIHGMKAEIGELQLQVQKLETGKRDDQLDECIAEDGAAQTLEITRNERDYWEAQARAIDKERTRYKDMWKASARESKTLAAQRDQNAILNDERVRQEVQLATDILRRDFAATNAGNYKLTMLIRRCYAQYFEEDDKSPLEDLIHHTFTSLGDASKNTRKLKRLLERWLEMPENPNARLDLITETKEKVCG